jgi:hypothetical protein
MSVFDLVGVCTVFSLYAVWLVKWFKVHAYSEVILVSYESTVLLIGIFSRYFGGKMSPIYLLRDELVYELAIRGVRSETWRKFVAGVELCWQSMSTLDSVSLCRLNVAGKYELILKMVENWRY